MDGKVSTYPLALIISYYTFRTKKLFDSEYTMRCSFFPREVRERKEGNNSKKEKI